MSVNVPRKAKSNVPLLESGVYPAICIGLVDFGAQFNKRWNKTSEEIQLVFEVVGEMVDIEGEDMPRWLSQGFTKSLGDKSNLRAALKTWRGRDINDGDFDGADNFDLEQLIGMGCQLSVAISEDGQYNNVSGIMGLPKGIKAARPISDTFVFDMHAENAAEVYAKLPQWMRDKIDRSLTWQEIRAGSEDMDMDDDPKVDMETGEIKREGRKPTF
ncbi:MAG: hypothetical protein LBD02_01310 [Christensenellaceae bacterium]|jgi:hypothetical protein|nr:hypothetical protein [Christensenellaceae bacterium]